MENGFRLNGWEVWSDGWPEFVAMAHKAKYPIYHPVTGLGLICFYDVDELLSCFKAQPISIDDTMKLETLLIDTVGKGANHKHIPYDGYMPVIDFEREDDNG